LLLACVFAKRSLFLLPSVGWDAFKRAADLE
jgi:hypothetical protein